MGAILFIIFSVLLYVGKILFHARHLTFDKWCEIFISFFIFTNCLGFGLTIFDLNQVAPDGVFGYRIRLEVFMLIFPFTFTILAKRMQWKFLPIPWYTVLFIVLFCAINLFNPNNMAVQSTVIALIQLVCYIAFLYLVCSCVPIEVLIKGMYEGFVYTAILQSLLTICYPILGITQVIDLFHENVSIRAEERPGAPGTFAHPNVLGGYMAYIVAFFTTCYILGYNKHKSLIFGLLSFFVLIFTFSRSALLAAIVAIITMILILATKNSSIFSIKNIFTRILPMIVAAAALIFLTPIKNSFIGSNMDEMMVARLMHYYCGAETVIDHPIIGVGLNAHLEYIRTHIDPRILALFNQTAWKPERFIFSNPIHNIFLIFLTEFGILGTIPIIWFIIHKFRKIKPALRQKASIECHIAELFSIGLLCCLLVHGLSDWAPLNATLRNIWIFTFFISAFAYRKNAKS